MRHGAGQQLDLPAIQLGVHAIAVVLDLVQPIVAGQGLVNGARRLRLDPFRRPIGLSHESYCSTAHSTPEPIDSIWSAPTKRARVDGPSGLGHRRSIVYG